MKLSQRSSKCVNFCNRAGLEDPNQYYFNFQSSQSIKSFPRSSCICLNTFLSLRKKVGYTKWIHKMSFLCHSFWIVVYDSFLLSCTKLHYSKYNVFKSQVTNTKQNKKSTRCDYKYWLTNLQCFLSLYHVLQYINVYLMKIYSMFCFIVVRLI